MPIGYGIARKISAVFGHGSAGDEQAIARTGGYGTGEFPPIFCDKDSAAKYIDGMDYPFFYSVVEIEIRDEVEE